MIRRFGRFSLVGLMGAGLQVLLVSWLTPRIGLAATPVAVQIVILHNFLWHERFTWSDRGPGRVAIRLWRFHAGNGLISLVGNTVLMYLLVERLNAPVALAAAAAIAVCSLLNFLVADRWVYATRGSVSFGTNPGTGPRTPVSGFR